MTTGTLKVCSICREELDGKKRFKDGGGTYFCPPCWEARTELFGAAAAPAPATPPPLPTRALTQPKAAPVVQATTPAAAPANFALQKLGYFAVGVAAVGFFDLWPLYQASTHADELFISLKGIMLGWVLFCISLIAMLPERIGVAWTRAPGRPASAAETLRIKVLFGGAVGLGVAASIATYLYIQHLGYTIHF